MTKELETYRAELASKGWTTSHNPSNRTLTVVDKDGNVTVYKLDYSCGTWTIRID